ncbi:MAG: flagellar motor protein MotB [Bacteroidota bacterium]
MAKKKHQEHENSERWLLTYADLITLLLALFVVLWSLSKMDQRQVLESMAGVFGEDQGSQGVLEGSGGAVVTGAIARSLQQQAEAKKIMDKLISQKQDNINSATYQ